MKLFKRKNPAIIILAAAAVLAVMLATVFPLAGCGGEDSLSRTAQSFINTVARIKTPVTIESGAEIDACYILYEHTTERDRTDEEVIRKKEMLDGYKSEYAVLQEAEKEAELLAQKAADEQRFKSAVESLPSRLTSENRKDVDAAYALYEKLSEQSKAAVGQAYAALVKADEKVAAIEEEERLAEIAAAAQKFIEGVDEIGEVTLKSFNAIDDLLYDYSRFSDEVKDYEGVAEAKEMLDAALEEYYLLKDEDDVEKFLEYAEELSPVESKVTLDSGNTISKAEVLYEKMSERALAAEGVAEAHEILVSARAKYDELYAVAEAERIQIFIAAANKVRTDIENVDIDWFYDLEAAKDAYNALDYYSISRPEVIAAFNRYNAAQKAFDKKGYRQLPMTEPIVQIAGDGNVVIANEFDNQAVTKPLYSFYGAESKAELDNYARLMLNVYVDGVYQGKAALKFTDLGGPGHLIMSSTVISALRQLSETNGNVKSGASFSFALSYEDKDGTEVIPSPVSKISNAIVYTW